MPLQRSSTIDVATLWFAQEPDTAAANTVRCTSVPTGPRAMEIERDLSQLMTCTVGSVGSL